MSEPLVSAKVDSRLAREAFMRFPREFDRIVDPYLSRGVYEVARIAFSLAPKAFSTLSNSILSGTRKLGPLHYEIAPGVNYALATETGVKGPMAKQPGTANGLEEWIRFRTGETDPKKLSRLGFVIARSMKAKGIHAQPYMAPAAEQGRSRVIDLVMEGVAQSVKEIFG